MAMVSFSIKNVPADLAEALGERARANHRSLQGELMHIVSQAVKEGSGRKPRAFDPGVAQSRAKALGLKTAPDARQIVREMRDSR